MNQASNCGETDPEVTSLARQDPAKLQRLHDRLTSTNTSRLPAASQKQGANGMGNGDSRLMLSPGSPWSKVKSTEQRLPLKKNGTHNDFSTNNVQVRLLFHRALSYLSVHEVCLTERQYVKFIFPSVLSSSVWETRVSQGNFDSRMLNGTGYTVYNNTCILHLQLSYFLTLLLSKNCVINVHHFLYREFCWTY